MRKFLSRPITHIITALLVISTVLAACATFPSTSKPRDPWTDWGKMEPEFVILVLPQEYVQAICSFRGGFVVPPGLRILACVDDIGPLDPGAACLITISGDLWKEKYDRVLRHEKAHCRGWHHGDPVPKGEMG